MDIRQLETLVAVADGGSFAAAARVVNLTPSAISQQIQGLEGEAGTSLFDRKTRPSRLNAQGEELVRAARLVLQIMTEARDAISGDRTAGVLRFGALRTVSMRLVPQAMSRMRPAYPGLSFDLTVGMSEALMAHVAAGRLDAALVAEHVGVPPNLVWMPLLSEPLVLIAPPGTAQLTEAEIFRRLPFVRYATDVPLSRQIETEVSYIAGSLREGAVANTMPSVVGFVQAGVGFAIVPRVATQDIQPGSLEIRAFHKDRVVRRLGLVRRQVSARSKILDALGHALADVATESGITVLNSRQDAPAV